MTGSQATILWVIDHWAALIERNALSEHGYNVVIAAAGSEALRLLASNSVDAVVLDCQRSGTNEDGVAARIKDIKRETPVVVLSAQNPSSRKKFRSVDSVLSRSDASQLLPSTLQEFLDHPRKPFFERWLAHWKARNQGRTHETL